MNKFSVFCLILSIMIILSCTKSNKGATDNWSICKTVDSIPKDLYTKLSDHFKSPFKIANPNDRYNSTDFLNDSLPTKRLVFVGKSKNNCRLIYTQGGFAKYNVMVNSVLKNDKIVDLYISETTLALTSMDSIEKFISEKKITQKRIDLK